MKAKDLKSGGYYKNASGTFFYIISNTVANTKPDHRVLVLSTFNRSTSKWSPDVNYTYPDDHDVPIKAMTTLPLKKHSKDPLSNAKPGVMATKSVKKKAPSFTPKAPAKPAIEGNATSDKCLKCKGPTKEIPMFNSMTHWCPVCE